MNERIRSLPLGAGLMAGLVVALGIVIFRPSVAAAQPPGPPIPAGPCGALQMADFSAIPDAPTTIFSTQIVSATADQPEYCDVLGMISSQIQFELWLPTTWNDRYLQIGCGGYCGSLEPSEQCTLGLGQNFAVGWNNSGHVGGSPMSGGDALWAYDNQRLRQDFGYRSEHVMAIVAKSIIASFYGADPSYSYYQGCSNGGRQALQEAQRWPKDFDGIIAGAPAAIQAPLNGEYETWNGQANLDEQGNPILTTADLTFLNAAALANCDGLDGLVDGQITDPRRCTFDPAMLVCTGEEVAPAETALPALPAAPPTGTMTATLPLTDTGIMAPPPGDMMATETVTPTCLTGAQVEVVQKLYGGPVDAEGRALYPGHEAVGSELAWGQFVLGPAGMTPMAALIANGYLKYLAFPTSPPASFSYKDWEFTLEGFDKLRPMGEVYNATNPDLGAFVARGGKLILYHGWADPAIPPHGTIAYYQALQDTIGGLEATQEFARLYMVPGMYHCSGGNAPNSFDLLTPILEWVENGVAPEAIVAAQFSSSGSGGGFADPTAGGGGGEVVRTRPLCPYPLEQTYSGTGDTNDAANFACAMPDSDALVDGHYDWVGNDLLQPTAAEQVSTPAEEAGMTGSVAGDARVNLRSAPGTDADIIDKLEPGTQVTVAGRTAAGDWLRIALESGDGWVAAELIQLDGEPDPLPVVAP